MTSTSLLGAHILPTTAFDHLISEAEKAGASKILKLFVSEDYINLLAEVGVVMDAAIGEDSRIGVYKGYPVHIMYFRPNCDMKVKYFHPYHVMPQYLRLSWE